MNKTIIKRFKENEKKLLEVFSKKHPESYVDIVKEVVKAVSDLENEDSVLPLDINRITVIDHGDYQGSQLFIIAGTGYQPDRYWATEVSYGSCSGCDTLEGIRAYADEEESPSKTQAKDYLTLALHLAQKMEELFV